MLITYMGLSEYYRRMIPKVKQQGYILMVSLIARYADAEGAFDRTEKFWSSLHDLTNDKVLFVFSSPEVRKASLFLPNPKGPGYEGKICPFVTMIGDGRVQEGVEWEQYLTEEATQIDWKERHSQTITEFAREHGIAEEQIPCLYICSLLDDREYLLPIQEDENLYAKMKQIMQAVNFFAAERQRLEEQLEEKKELRNYYELYERLWNDEEGTVEETAAIRSVLCGGSSFQECKEQIPETAVRTDVKRILQWQRQFLSRYTEEEQAAYQELRREYFWRLEWFGTVLADMAGSHVKTAPLCTKNTNGEKYFLSDLVSVCLRLQGNFLYTDASENQRNDYVRDMLLEKGYDVKDQTRRGISSGGRDAGEIDILIEKGHHSWTLVEALNLASIRKDYLDLHLDKVYRYDTAGHPFNVVLVYVTAPDFGRFCERYYEHIRAHAFPYEVVETVCDCKVVDTDYAGVQVMKTVLRRSGRETRLWHVCVEMKG